MSYGSKVKKYREENLLSLQEFADLINSDYFSVQNLENGLDEPTDELKNKIKKIINKESVNLQNNIISNSRIDFYKIHNRRYLGNKYKLLPFIKQVVNENCTNINSIADIFSGTGAVSSAFWDKEIITNDLLYSCYISNLAWFGTEKVDNKKLINIISNYNSLEIFEENYMTKNFSNTYFSKENCSRIGYIREDIEKKFRNKEINTRERAVLITSLLYGMDSIANTCGHYDSFIKDSKFNKTIKIKYLDIPKTNNPNNRCFNEDSNNLVKKIYADLTYIDPPYNSRQYCDAYHLLENVAKWEKPNVFGKAKKMERENIKSKYCNKFAVEAFEDLIDNVKSRYILFSYNNAGESRNSRSNAKISDEEISRIFSKKGKLLVFSKNYKVFSTGKTYLKNNEERLFLCICG